MKEKFMKLFKWTMQTVRSFLDSHCSMHAAGLTYYVLLAIVPILCVLLTVAKACGADHLAKDKIHAAFESQISQFELDSGLAQNRADERQADIDAEKQETAAEADAEKKLAATQDFIRQVRILEQTIFERIESFNIGTLGWIGFGMLVWTVISTIGMIEMSFNQIWGIKKQRPLWKRVFLDLFVAIAMPILMTLAMSVPLIKLAKDIIVMTAGSLWLTKWVSDGVVWLIDSWVIRLSITLFFTTLVFAFLFKILPNRKVAWKPCFLAGLITAVLFGGWLKLCAIAQVGIAKSSALYGSFACLPIILAWLFMSWQIILLGCCISRSSSAENAAE